MVSKVVTWAALAIVAANFLLLLPYAATPRRYTDDVNTHYFWLNFSPGEYRFADELRRFQSVGWRLAGTVLSWTHVPPYYISSVLTLAAYGGFLWLAFLLARRLAPEEETLPSIFLLLLALHPTLARDTAGGLPRSWSPLLQMLGLLTALEFSRRQAGALVLSALLHPISFIVNVGVMGLEWAYQLGRHVWMKAAFNGRGAWRFAAVVVVIAGALWLDQQQIARIDGAPLKVREHEAFLKGYRSETDQIRDLGTALRRKFVSSNDQDYNYIIFPKRLNFEDDDEKRGDMRHLARVRRYLIMLFCVMGIYWGWRRQLLPRVLIWWAAAGVILYYLAVLLAWRLYAPDRYIFPMAIAVPCWLMAVFFATVIRRFGWLGTTPLIVFLLLWGTGVHPTYVFKNWDRWAGVAEYMRANVPREAMIAGHPRDTDPIPLLAGRKVLVAREFIQPWRPAQYDRNMRLAEQSIGLLYLTPEDMELLDKTGVDYLLIGKEWLRDRYVQGEAAPFDEPIGKSYQYVLSQTRTEDLLFHPRNHERIRESIVYEDEGFFLVDAAALKALGPPTLPTPPEESTAAPAP